MQAKIELLEEYKIFLEGCELEMSLPQPYKAESEGVNTDE